jgi:hypothetical protein
MTTLPVSITAAQAGRNENCPQYLWITLGITIQISKRIAILAENGPVRFLYSFYKLHIFNDLARKINNKWWITCVSRKITTCVRL